MIDAVVVMELKCYGESVWIFKRVNLPACPAKGSEVHIGPNQHGGMSPQMVVCVCFCENKPLYCELDRFTWNAQEDEDLGDEDPPTPAKWVAHYAEYGFRVCNEPSPWLDSWWFGILSV